MATCKDPALTYLNKDGYNVVRVPRTGIEPLDVLGRDGKSIEKLGSLCEVWKSTEPPPKASDPQPSANISGQKTQSLDLGIGLKMLASVLSGMGSGAGLPSLQSSYKSSRSVEFRFVDVYSVCVTPFALGNYLAHGSLNLANPVVQAYFGNEETDEFVITDVLKTSSVSVTAKGDSAIDVSLDVPAIQSMVGANVTVKVGSSSSAEIIYQGKSQLTFGFKAFQSFFENGRWSIRGIQTSGDLAFGQSPSGDGAKLAGEPVLLNEGGMVRIRPL
jgi:hypothetical protein